MKTDQPQLRSGPKGVAREDPGNEPLLMEWAEIKFEWMVLTDEPDFLY
jgi:hypothetical protein